MPTTNPIEAPRPEAPPYTWPNQDLKNLVQLAPMSPYTRALLRIKFNRQLPDGCTTFEQIESWLATLPPVRFSSPPAYSHRPPAPSRNVEIQRGEFITVEARIYGSETQYVGWSKEGGVDVPLSVWQDGAEAVRAARAQSFDLVLMDLQMPVMDGLQATREIRALRGDWARVPIYALTAAASHEDQAAALAAGMDDFLTKPFMPEDLEAALARAAGGGRRAVA